MIKLISYKQGIIANGTVCVMYTVLSMSDECTENHDPEIVQISTRIRAHVTME